MPQYISKDEEKDIRTILDELAEMIGLHSPKKESYFRDMGYYLDRLWYMELEEKLKDELELYIHRRIFPGKCRFCPRD